jgi:hypothetical protein
MGTKHAGILEDALRTPPLSGPVCPDPRYTAGRALVLQGPQAHLGALWVLTASLAGQPASTPGPLPPIPPIPPLGVPEGSVPFADVDGTLVLVQPPADQGATVFIDDTDT